MTLLKRRVAVARLQGRPHGVFVRPDLEEEIKDSHLQTYRSRIRIFSLDSCRARGRHEIHLKWLSCSSNLERLALAL